MKQIILTFGVLLSAFFIIWGIKLRTPINRPENTDDGTVLAWYEQNALAPNVGEQWILDASVPDDYIPVPGEDNLFLVIDENGNIVKYVKGTKNEDGKWSFEEVNPDIPNNYELVNGTTNLYKVTEPDGTVSYYLYVRNEDGSYCFVEANEFGEPWYEGADAEVITNNFVHEDGNIYSVYNKDGVKEGYAERKRTDKGGYQWKKVTKKEMLGKAEEKKKKAAEEKKNKEKGNQKDEDATIASKKLETPTEKESNIPEDANVNVDGSYVIKNTDTETVEEDGYRVTYQTITYNTYNKNNEIIGQKKEGPTEIERVKIEGDEGVADTSLVADTLDGEYKRVSKQVSYDKDKAKEVLKLLNEERKNAGLDELSMSKDSDTYKLACIKAADMAIYNYADSTSKMYGTLDDMIEKWSISAGVPSENIWKAGNKSAKAINKSFMSNANSKDLCLSSNYTEVGIAIVEQNGHLYIAEIFIK